MAAKKARKSGRQQHETRPTRRPPRLRGFSRVPLLTDEEWGVVLRRHYRRRQRQKIAGWSLLAAAILIAVNHFLEHVNTVDVLGAIVSPSTQDIIAGWPIAVVIALAGVLFLGQLDDPPDREYVTVD